VCGDVSKTEGEGEKEGEMRAGDDTNKQKKHQKYIHLSSSFASLLALWYATF
jgi:hypothetical protein